MKTKTTLLLLIVTVAVGLYIKFYESKQPNTEEAKRQAGNVVNFDRDTLEGIEINDVASLTFRSEEHTSELQSQSNLVCRLLLEKKKKTKYIITSRARRCSR